MTLSSFQYHEKTNYQRDKMPGHSLDWTNQPTVNKIYPGIEPVKLPQSVQNPKKDLSAVLESEQSNDTASTLDIETLSAILLLTYTHTAKTRHGEEDFYYRSAASAGALYPTEMYVSLQDIKGLEQGLYHFSVSNHGLSPLRKGELAYAVKEATGLKAGTLPIATFFFTAIYFRSAWKYRVRSYRYHLLDTGHVAENLTLALKSMGLPYILSYDFDDKKINHLLGVDETRETCLAVCHVLGQNPAKDRGSSDLCDLSDPIKKASQVSKIETYFRSVGMMHSEGTKIKSTNKEVKTNMTRELGPSPKTWTPLPSSSPPTAAMEYAKAVFHRRSRRNFVREPIPQASLQYLLHSLCKTDIQSQGTPLYHTQSLCAGLLIGQVEGFEPGFYLLDTESSSLGMVTPGLFIDKMAKVSLDQEWLANAAVHFLFMANLNILDETWGARGYRYAMMMAGRMGERLYIAATALGLGCCGIGALFDEEAVELLSLNTKSRLLYLLGVGQFKSTK